MSTILELTSAQLKQAADIKDQIEALNHQLNALLGGKPAPVAAPVQTPAPSAYKPAKKGGMSAAGKARIAAAQRLRWAKAKAAKAGMAPAETEAPVKKRKMSAAGRARIIAAQKLRWAKIKAKGGATATSAKPGKKKRTMSAAAKAAIAAAARARWARAKAAGRSSL